MTQSPIANRFKENPWQPPMQLDLISWTNWIVPSFPYHQSLIPDTWKKKKRHPLAKICLLSRSSASMDNWSHCLIYYHTNILLEIPLWKPYKSQ